MKKLKESNEISEDIDSVKEGSSNQETGSGTKTPAMVLKEYLGISPNYIFKKLDSDPLSFHCELKLFDKYYAEAVALTKKQAKHRTAMDMLVKMSQDRLEVKKLLKECNVHEQEDLIQETDNVSTESESVEVSKIQNSSTKTPVSLLHEYLVDQKELPDYEFSKVDSDPSSLWFHCKLKILNGRYFAEATGLTKKQAKHKTAKNMLIELSQDRPEVKHLLKECSLLDEQQEKLMQEIGRTSTRNESLERSNIRNGSLERSNKRNESLERPNIRNESLERSNKRNESLERSNTRNECLERSNMKNESLERTNMRSEGLERPNIRNESLERSNKRNESSERSNMRNESSERSNTRNGSLERSNNQEVIMKTPVSLLQEYLVEQGTVPRYIARELSTGPSTPKVFQYELSIFGGQYQSTGSGQSKKQAKHEAANNMLLKLSEQRPDLKKLLERNDFYEKMDKVTSNNSSIKNNSIFQLDSYCRYHNFNSPEYTFIEETGDPHNKTFTMKCEVEKIIVEGTGNKIQAAKHNSAAKMLVRLQEELNKIAESEKNHSMVECVKLLPSDVGFHQADTSDKCEKLEEKKIDKNIVDEYKLDRSKVAYSSVETDETPQSSKESKLLLNKLNACNEDVSPRVECVEVELEKIKCKQIIHGSRFKTPADVKSNHDKIQNSLANLDLNIVSIINQVKLNKGFAIEDNAAFFKYLEQAPVEDLFSIVDVLKCDKDVIIDVIHFRNSPSDDLSQEPEYKTNCRLRAKEVSVAFKSLGQNRKDSERKVYILLLKYLSTLNSKAGAEVNPS
ncbi:hypothetical protein M8J76_013137 [Diaphorina citri]|nr:hypothetical protein M8J75_012351 [Diaphorina citri]KAI5745312.1 hypothetical protein M8J76_010008 [Diaphorina citri]KAI5745652.1 hypothetical protein M8J76_013137 [Diaphorina citri]